MLYFIILFTAAASGVAVYNAARYSRRRDVRAAASGLSLTTAGAVGLLLLALL